MSDDDVKDDDDQKPIADDVMEPDLDDGVLSADKLAEQELAGATSRKLVLDEVVDDDVVDVMDDEEEEELADDDEM